MTRGRADSVVIDPEQIVEAIHSFNGNLAAVAKAVGTPYQTLRDYVKRDPEVAAELQVARESMLDMAESALYREVLRGEAWAICFFLKTQGRKRGYIERAETFNLKINLDNLTIEQLERLAQGEHPSLVLGAAAEASGSARAADDPLTIEGTSRLSAEEEAGG